MKKTEDLNQMRLLSTSPADFAKRLEKYAASRRAPMAIQFVALCAVRHACACSSKPIGDNFQESWDGEYNYPALRGMIVMEKKNKSGRHCLEVFIAQKIGLYPSWIPGLCIGTGGGSGYHDKYDVTLWLSDFPLWGNKVLKILDIEEDICSKNNLNLDRQNKLESLINQAIEDNAEIRELRKKINDLTDKISKEIGEKNPSLEKLDISELENQLKTLESEISIY